ncbi:MAG: DUF6931 family protein [Acetobacteraceae bacterium]
MSQSATKLAAADLPTIRSRLALDDQAEAAVKDCRTAPEALDALEAAGLLLQAARLVAHALPKREAVWWACMCAQHTAPADLPAPDRQARETAEAWVRDPSDKLARQALAEAQAGGCTSPEAWAGVAAAWSGESLAPAGQAIVPPSPHLTGTAVIGSVQLASVRGDPLRQPQRLKHFLESARSIAAGGPGRLPPEEP